MLERTARVGAQLYGSLALTGLGHCTDRAVLLGLEGHRPDRIEPEAIEPSLARIRSTGRLQLRGTHEIEFDEPLDLLLHRDQTLPRHTNGMRFTALDAGGAVLHRDEFYSIGGGFVVRGEEYGRVTPAASGADLPHPYSSGNELLAAAREQGLELHELVLANERALRTDEATTAALLGIWVVMNGCIERGLHGSGLLPGVLKVRRRAARMHRMLVESAEHRPLDVMDWVNAFALAVNEENAAGGRVVTAPTNGAAGIVPAVHRLLPPLRAWRERRRHRAVPAGRGRDRHALQAQRVDLGRRDGLPGRGRRGLLDGGRGPGRGVERHQ